MINRIAIMLLNDRALGIEREDLRDYIRICVPSSFIRRGIPQERC